MSGTQSLWIEAWWEPLGLPAGAPVWLMALFALMATYCLVVLPGAAAVSYLERKLGADLQARIGPNRAGFAGMLQPLADVLKLLQKQTDQRWSLREALWLGVHTMALYSTVAVMPLGSVAVLVDTEMSVLLPFWAALVLSLGTMLLGLNQGSVPGWFGGIRVAAQGLAGAFPALVALLAAGVRAQSFRWTALAGAQGAWPLQWTAFADPFQLIAFVVFVMSGLVLLGVPPLDGGMSISDIHGGVSAHLHGRRLTLFRLGRFYGFFFWSVISVVLFLGGWATPFGMAGAIKDADGLRWLQLIELGVVLTKTFCLMLVVVWVAKVSPRGRVDQITDLAWKVLSPLSIFALVGASLWVGWRTLG